MISYASAVHGTDRLRCETVTMRGSEAGMRYMFFRLAGVVTGFPSMDLPPSCDIPHHLLEAVVGSWALSRSGVFSRNLSLWFWWLCWFLVFFLVSSIIGLLLALILCKSLRSGSHGRSIVKDIGTVFLYFVAVSCSSTSGASCPQALAVRRMASSEVG